jgi:hypothetical protein
MAVTTTRTTFNALMHEVVEFIGDRPLDAALEAALNERYPASGTGFSNLKETCRSAIAEGWMCEREAGGIRYGRVIQSHGQLRGFSVDVVDMHDVKGPHHRHPNGEIDLIMPLSAGATFDDRGAGWLVYGPDSAHHPTARGGQALVLYLLPRGAIEFTR